MHSYTLKQYSSFRSVTFYAVMWLCIYIYVNKSDKSILLLCFVRLATFSFQTLESFRCTEKDASSESLHVCQLCFSFVFPAKVFVPRSGDIIKSNDATSTEMKWLSIPLVQGMLGRKYLLCTLALVLFYALTSLHENRLECENL